MSETTLQAPASRWRPSSTAALVGGAVLLVSLGAGAGWLMRGDPPAPKPEAMQNSPLSLAPPTAGSSQLAGDDEVSPPPKSAPARSDAAAPAQKPAPTRAAAHPAQQPAPRSAAVCQACGVVEGVTEIKRKGEANGVGAVGGAVVGGLLGNQVGGGNGRKAMTVIGAVGGGLAGHEIEKRARGDTVYQVRVRMDNGSTRTITLKDPPAAGARVVVEGQSLRVV